MILFPKPLDSPFQRVVILNVSGELKWGTSPLNCCGLALSWFRGHLTFLKMKDRSARIQLWRGHLWQGRFASYAMEERYLLAAVRYIEMNPVRAGLVDSPGEYPWSSAAAHIFGCDDPLVKVSPLLEHVDDWGRFIGGQIAERDVSFLRRHERTGRPLSGESFIDRLERALSRRLRKQKPGPKPN